MTMHNPWGAGEIHGPEGSSSVRVLAVLIRRIAHELDVYRRSNYVLLLALSPLTINVLAILISAMGPASMRRKPPELAELQQALSFTSMTTQSIIFAPECVFHYRSNSPLISTRIVADAPQACSGLKFVCCVAGA